MDSTESVDGPAFDGSAAASGTSASAGAGAGAGAGTGAGAGAGAGAGEDDVVRDGMSAAKRVATGKRAVAGAAVGAGAPMAAGALGVAPTSIKDLPAEALRLMLAFSPPAVWEVRQEITELCATRDNDISSSTNETVMCTAASERLAREHALQLSMRIASDTFQEAWFQTAFHNTTSTNLPLGRTLPADFFSLDTKGKFEVLFNIATASGILPTITLATTQYGARFAQETMDRLSDDQLKQAFYVLATLYENEEDITVVENEGFADSSVVQLAPYYRVCRSEPPPHLVAIDHDNAIDYSLATKTKIF